MRICVIDFESFGLEVDSPVFDFGWVIMETRTTELISGGTFPIAWDYNERNSAQANPNTISWWISKAANIPELLTYVTEKLEASYKCSHLETMEDMREFSYSLDDYHVEALFCTDKSFDYAILRRMLKHFNLTFPLNYKQVYETRLLSEMIAPQLFKDNSNLKNTIAHTPQDDALILAHKIATFLNTPSLS